MARISRAKIDAEMNKFGKEVVRVARGNLSRDRSNASKTLWKSIRYRWEESKQIIRFYMAPYGDFINSGVTGHGRGTYTSKRRMARSTKGYEFKTGPGLGSGTKMDRLFQDWLRVKNVQIRNAQGQYVDRKTASYLVRRNTGRFGIEPTGFWDKSFDAVYPKYSPIIDRTIGTAIEDSLDEILSQLND